MNTRTFLGIALICLPLLACGGSSKSIQAGEAIPGLKLSGKWFSPEFGDLDIVHAGQNVQGTYADRRGPDHNGRFRGHLKGDLVRLEWIKPGNAAAAIMPRRGRAWLRVSRDGLRLTGRWGFEQSDTDGGPWTAEKVDSDD